jgi:TetR/AcrR family transcriptional regulator, fatty acid metabolism regulator protein
MTKRKKQALKTKENIFNSAIAVMQKHGFEEATIEQICKKARVSVGSFYNYFKSKNDLLFQVYEYADQYYKDIVAPELESVDLKQKVLIFFKHYALYNEKTGVDFVKRLYGNYENKLFIKHDRYMHELMHTVLVSARKNGELKTDIPAGEIEQFMFILARGVVSDWCLYDGKYDLSKKLLDYFEFILPLFIK